MKQTSSPAPHGKCRFFCFDRRLEIENLIVGLQFIENYL